MNDIIVNEIATVSIEILTQIEKHEEQLITELYRKSNIPIYYKQSNFTYYFIKYIDILNFFILNETIKLNELVKKDCKDIISSEQVISHNTSSPKTIKIKSFQFDKK